MVQPRLQGRAGLVALSDGSGQEQLHADDWNQLAQARLAHAQLACSREGGAGRHLGGADTDADLGSSGTTYPALAAWVLDRGGRPWPVRVDTWRAIDFGATSGAAKLWLRLTTVPGASPAEAIGGADDVVLLALPETDPAPADALLLGVGTVTTTPSPRFTSYTGEPAIAHPPEAHAASHQNGGGDEISVAGLSGLLADGQTPLAHAASHAAAGSDPLSGYALLAADNTFAAVVALTNGRLRNARDAKFGPPASGTYAVGDLWLDRAGALWQCAGAGTPGTWEQLSTGRAGTWSGATAADITAAANWNGGALLSGYVVHDTTKRMTYEYNGTSWLGPEVTVPMQPGHTWVAGGYGSTSTYPFIFFLPPAHDIVLSGISVRVGGAAGDASNYWTFSPLRFGGSAIGTAVSKTDGPTSRFDIATLTTVYSSSHDYLYLSAIKTGSPSAITSMFCTLTYRYVRK